MAAAAVALVGCASAPSQATDAPSGSDSIAVADTDAKPATSEAAAPESIPPTNDDEAMTTTTDALSDTAAEQALDPTLAAAIDQRLLVGEATMPLEQRLEELSIPGAAIVVVDQGVTVAELAIGTTPDGDPMTTDTMLQVGSVSKPVAAATIATLVADGALDWATPAPLTNVGVPVPAGVEVDFAQLLSHTAGVNVDGFLGYESPEEAPDLAEVIAGEGNTAPIAVDSALGEFRYSGGGYVLAAEAATTLDGASSFAELAQRQLFGPLGMSDSVFALEPPADRLDRVSEGAVGLEGLESGWQRHPEHAAAGLWTTADDLAIFLTAFGASLAGDPDALLPPDVAAEMIQGVVTFNDDGAAVGRGWFLDDLDQPTVYRHNGRNIGYTAEIAGTVDGRYGVVVVTNSFPGGTDLARDVIATIAAELEW